MAATSAPSAQARLTLQDAFERFAATVTHDDQRLFNNTTLKDVRDEAIKIERQLRTRYTQQNMVRLDPFLCGAEHYSKVLEVLCNGTPFLPWIWAPVKLMLMITVDSRGAFEKLIDAYGKIADMMPRLDRLQSALSHDSNFQNVLALVYSDILEFHRRAYRFVRRKSWAIFFGSMWSGFETRFDTILRRLAYHGELLEKEANAVNISDAGKRNKKEDEKWNQQEREWQALKAARGVDISNTVKRNKEEDEKWDQQEREWRAVKVQKVLSWLRTNDSLPDDALEKHLRNCLPNSCDWFIQHPKTQLWSKDGAENALLWLYGKPGAGKSVMCSSLVQHNEASAVNVFFYFCSYLGDSTEGSSRLLRSLVFQIIQKHQDLAVYVYDVYFQTHPVPSRKALLNLLPELLKGLGSVRFVIDGIDEWDACHQKDLIKDLTQMLSTDPTSYICKILLASRDTLEISRSIGKKNKGIVSISLSDSNEGISINRSIRLFINTRLSDLPDHFDELDPGALILADVKQTLLNKSHGMFLWVRLVLDTLETVYSPKELRKVVDDLPSDLEALYGNIFGRLCNARGPQGYGGVPRIMSWICSARRPLHKHELLHGLAEVDGQSVPLAQILDHCKPFVEERTDSTIVLVHLSVKEFFLNCKAPQIVPSIQIQLDIASTCVATLLRGLGLLRPDTTPSYTLLQIASGSYRFLPYALEFWIEHCLLYASAGGPLDVDHILSRRLAHLRDNHDQILESSSDYASGSVDAIEGFEGKLDDRIKLFAHIPIYDLMRGVTRARWSASQRACENGEAAEAFIIQNDRTLFSQLATKFDSDVIHLLSQSELAGVPKIVLEAFHKSYAATAFRCRYPQCSNSLAGFASQLLRAQHEAGHFHRVYCQVELCQWKLGFEKKSGLDAHIRKHHSSKSAFLIPPRVRRAQQDDMDAPTGEGLLAQRLQLLKTEDVSNMEHLSEDQKQKYWPILAGYCNTVNSTGAGPEHQQALAELQELSQKLIMQERLFRKNLKESDQRNLQGQPTQQPGNGNGQQISPQSAQPQKPPPPTQQSENPGAPAQAGQPRPQVANQQVPEINPEIIKHVQASQFYLPVADPLAGTPAGDQKLQDFQINYLLAQNKQREASWRINMIDKAIEARQRSGKEIPPEFAHQRAQLQSDYKTAEEYVDEFRMQQAVWKREHELQRLQQQQPQGG